MSEIAKMGGDEHDSGDWGSLNQYEPLEDEDMKEVMSEETREMLKRSLQSILDRNDGDINPGNSDYYDEVSRALEQLKKEDEKQNEAEVQSTVEDPYSSPEQ